jgi:hypothetical protein
MVYEANRRGKGSMKGEERKDALKLFTAIQYELFQEFLPAGFVGLAFDDDDDDQGDRVWDDVKTSFDT